MMADPLRVGLAGAGMISLFHLTAWQRAADARIVAIADPDPEAARARAETFGVTDVFLDPVEMMDAAALDAIDITAPMEHHAAIVRAAADRGIPVHCQKPLCPTLAEAEALVAEVGDRVRFMVHENWRFRPPYRRARQWITEGRVGTPRAFAMELMSSGLVPTDAGTTPPALLRQPFMAGMRRFQVLESLIHQLDTLRYLLDGLTVGAARVTRISDLVRGEDTAMILLEGGNGCPGTLSASMSAADRPPRSADRLRIIGDAGVILFEEWELRCTSGEIAERFDPDETYQASFDATIAHFVDRLRSGAPFETEARQNLATLALVEDVYRLAAEQS